MKRKLKLLSALVVSPLIIILFFVSATRGADFINGTPSVTVKDGTATVNISFSSGTGTIGGDGQTAGGDPTVTSFTPAKIPAGKNDGSNEVYMESTTPFEVAGTNLDGSQLSIDGNDAIKFTVTESTSTSIKGNIVSQPSATKGDVSIKILNNAGKSVTQAAKVTVTGTQILRDYFGTKARFIGEWPNPDDTTTDTTIATLESVVDAGLSYVNNGKYAQLGVTPVVYAKDVWSSSGCGIDPAKHGADSWGCAAPTDNIIRIRDVSGVANPQEITITIFHESTHKLNYLLDGEYSGGSVPTEGTTFQTEWDNAIGDTTNCEYLPLVDSGTWKGGDPNESYIPHCGFIQAYGAYFAYGKFYEDPATLSETSVFYSDRLTGGDFSTDPRYNIKLELLKKYGFI